MEHRNRVSRSAQGHGHIAQLRQSRISHHALDVVLNHAQKAHEECRNRAHHHNHAQSGGAEFIHRRHARHHKQACRYHGSRVNQSRNRCRAFHRIGQPHMQRKLRRLTHCADKQQQTGYRHQRPLHAREKLDGGMLHIGQIGKHIRIAQAAAEISQHQADAEQKAEIADTVNQKGFQVGKNGTLAFEVKTDQEVRHQAHGFPTEEKLHEIVAHHQHQHRKGKQRNITEKALIAGFFIVHIADGVNVHHQRHAGHHHHHHGSQAVDQKADGKIQAAHGQPGIHIFIKFAAAAIDKAPQHICRQHRRHRHAQNGYAVRAGTTDLFAKQTRQQRADKRCQGNGQI